ncbi:MAG: exodeoxyribonuclease VII small subunit [Verrucomicrobia bacterium]|nr:MAG: exodeoxyribonuclease VII small subunit [Verrucomicrobiota bacterium]
MTDPHPSPDPASPPQSLEKAMQRLEEIVQTMESEKLSLDTLITSYEEGVKLVKFCQGQLDSAEQRIRMVTCDLEGKVSLQPFDQK